MRRPKYGNKRTEYNGRTYASKAEANRAMDLDALLAAGEIDGWKAQPRVELEPGIRCRPDFEVWGKTHWFEDVKGAETERFKLVKKLWRLHGPADLHVLHVKSGQVELVQGKEASRNITGAA